MIKRQYNRWRHDKNKSYFDNFIDAHNPDAHIEDELKPYNVTLGKTKAPNYKLNVKWHDPKQYILFVLRWS